MATINCLHLTDLHRGLQGQESLWPNLEESFFADLRLLCDKHGPIDLILFTGDLVQKGAIEEFSKLNETLERLYACLQKLNSAPVLLAVPGNHDLVRPKPTSPEVLVLGDWTKKADVAAEFWRNPKSSYRKMIVRCFKNYMDWWTSHPFPRAHEHRQGCLPGDFAATFRKDSVALGIVGVNSAFLQLTEGDFKNRLAVHPIQLSSACGEHFTDWFDEHQTCLLLTHHPSDWLSEEARAEFEGEIFPPGRFTAHLFGHMHESRSTGITLGGASVRHFWQAPSLFGLEYYGDKKMRSHGYSFCQLQINSSVGTMRLWPRIAARHQANHFHICKDTSFTLEADEGTRPESVTLRNVLPALHPVKPGRFRVLVVATEADLTEARRKTVQYLSTALGIEAVEASSAKPVRVHEFDLAVLLQGWCWEEGKAVDIWKQAEERRRYALLVEEGADWPPRRLTERDKERLIEDFRQSVKRWQSFRDPMLIPEIVGKIVSDEIAKLDSITGNNEAGLKAWERRYLGFRIPAWLSGRTAGRPHVLEPDATELYKPELYVPLNGTSLRWTWTKGASPKLIAHKAGRDDRIDREKLDTEAPLARWISHPDLRRVALVGAPGGGKTVFLTRIAAAFGNACLGRPSELEASLNLSNLRSTAGTVPIPVVLEASRIAKHKLQGHDILLQAIADEFGQAGSPPPKNVLDRALRDGRYIVFVDALDEIADSARRLEILDVLKGASAKECYPKLRLIITTRSARYTGVLALGPELEIIQVSPLQEDQVRLFCQKWTAARKKDPTYLTDLMSAVSSLTEQIAKEGADGAMTANPLMLTAICMVFERYGALPNDRARLCGLLVDDLCRSRNSEDTEHNWSLSDANKRDLLERIAFAMQEEGAQFWPTSKAIEIAMRAVPTTEKLREMRATKHLHWAAEHTGLLRFQQPEQGEEEVRFWHRLFREFLVASRLSQEDATVATLVEKLWESKHLNDPFWEDVVRLLPRTLGTIEKAKSLRDQLERLSNGHSESRGRLLGLSVAGMIESRDLFPDIDFPQLALRLAGMYETDGYGWPVRDRLLFLEGLGNLDPSKGDPRLHEERWVCIKAGRIQRPIAYRDRNRTEKMPSCLLAWAPVTVQEFREFLNSSDCLEDKFWPQVPPTRRYGEGFRNSYLWRKQLRHLNWPVTNVSYEASVAYCNWKTAHRSDGMVVRLPTKAEQLMAVKSLSLTEKKLHQMSQEDCDKAIGNLPHLAIGRPTPVGTFKPIERIGLADIFGNVLEWTLRAAADNSLMPRVARNENAVALPSWKGCWDRLFGSRLSFDNRLFAPEWVSEDWIGFRCALQSPKKGEEG